MTLKKALTKIEEVIESELDDYGYFDYKESKFEEQIETEYYFNIIIEKNFQRDSITIYVKYDSENDELYIDMNDDGGWEKIESYDWTIKHLWMKLLKWE